MVRPPLISMDFPGAAALEQALRDLGEDPEIRKSLGASMMEAAEPMARAMRQKAPRRSGETAEGIEISKTLSRRQRRAAARAEAEGKVYSSSATVYVGPKATGPAVLAEFGTQERRWKDGKSTGRMQAHPFARPGFEETKFEVIRRFGDLLWIQIEKAAKRIARRKARIKK
jgi:HK97 gp10 family phage protein